MLRDSRRSKRMEAHHRRHGASDLNLVSLMDIFTILVFFLLVSSSNVENLPNPKAVRLPESLAEKAPKDAVVIAVGGEDIIVQGRRVAGIAETLAQEENLIPGLKAELDHQAGRARVVKTAEGGETREITIMGDREIPYRLLKKIMMTCVAAKFESIQLAVQKRESAGGKS